MPNSNCQDTECDAKKLGKARIFALRMNREANTTRELLSIVISVYNEEDNVVPLFSNIIDQLSPYDLEVIFVDDGSNDLTLSNLQKLDDSRLHILELRKNYGQSAALSAGIDYAKGKYISTMDGDLQNDPSDIPSMLSKLILEDWDLVIGERTARKDNKILRKAPSRVANFIIRKFTGVHLRDYGCALKVFKAEIAKDMGLYGELHRFIPVLATLEGARICQVPVKHHPRLHGKSKYNLSRTPKVLSDLMLMIFFRKYLARPMHLFGAISLILITLGSFIMLFLLILKFTGQDIWGRPILLLGILFIVVGFQLITFGLILEVLMRTYYESQGKTPYHVRTIHTNE